MSWRTNDEALCTAPPSFDATDPTDGAGYCRRCGADEAHGEEHRRGCATRLVALREALTNALEAVDEAGVSKRMDEYRALLDDALGHIIDAKREVLEVEHLANVADVAERRRGAA